MAEPFSFRMRPVYVEEGSTAFGRWTLRRFQEEVYEALRGRRDLLLVAPTGAGKTLTLLLGERGAVGVYPNNTLLLDQQRSIDAVLRGALGAKVEAAYTSSDGYDVLRVYSFDAGGEVPAAGAGRVAVALLSGRYIGYEKDASGRLVPKRTTILENIVERVCYSPGVYLVTLATPDTALMVMAGIYRDFEEVGYTLHDILVGAEEGRDLGYMLSRYRVATKSVLGDLAQIRQCLLKHPWFLDEFHLYGAYEASALLPVVKVFKDYMGWEEPIVLSSATPTGGLYREIQRKMGLTTIKATVRDNGPLEALVRGETEVEVVPVETGRRGLAGWLSLGYRVPGVVEERVGEIGSVVSGGGNVIIAVDRVNQVPPIVDVLRSHGFEPECSVSVEPPGCSGEARPVLVGSESISQGIDRPNVRYGIVTAYSWAKLLQRVGRIGRKTESKVVVLVPLLRKGVPLERLAGREVAYGEFAEAVESEYPDVDRSGKHGPLREIMETRSAAVEYMAVVSAAHVSGAQGVFEELGRLLAGKTRLLDSFYTPPEALAGLLLFRRSGFPVLVEKPGGGLEVVDVGIVLRNFRVVDVDAENYEAGGVEKRLVKFKVSLEAGRSKLVLERSGGAGLVRHDAARSLRGRVTTLGMLLDLGYRLVLKSWEKGSGGFEFELPVSGVGDVLSQAVALAAPPAEIVEYYVYTGEGVEVEAGERSLLALFL